MHPIFVLTKKQVINHFIKINNTMEYFVKQNTWLLRGITDHGWGNGYVVIPKGHPLHGMSYSEIEENIPELQVNGGLTFSQSAEDIQWDELPKDCKDGWVVGFDTAHSWDTLEMWSKDNVVKETEKLRNQLLEYQP